MNLLKTINQLSFKHLTTLTAVLGLTIAIPVSVYVLQQQTRIGSEATFEKPQPIVPTQEYGLPSEGNPIITLVWPFLGKVGDSVLIYGENLGNNPIDKTLRIGNQYATDKEIKKWTPNLIEFNIPENTQSGSISIRVVDKTSSWPYPFTIYDFNTPTQVTESNNIVQAINGPTEGRIQIFMRDGQKIESQNLNSVNVPDNKNILSVQVLDKFGNPVAFFVEPEEFGF